jgi:hypothetical protein
MAELEPITRVIFRTWPNGDVIALMPDEDFDGRRCTSYMHLGQHGGASYPLVVRLTRPATPEEYGPLLRELESNSATA